jgi:hypothetical protein
MAKLVWPRHERSDRLARFPHWLLINPRLHPDGDFHTLTIVLHQSYVIANKKSRKYNRKTAPAIKNGP